ncbi:hypothetical protein [Rhizobium azibense]|uniref:Lipoprotein n=1 Tax=Rhizobium azibense TaxID=1136135 RepID=A0A4R3RGF6_9HYPH|nr:hypothetical protein [Rhizobium azibense]TCU34091.1 hypothetical protein EV129_11374 [Rhizobium azibense]
MKKISLILTMSLMASLAACATPPDRIKPSASDGQPCSPADMKRLNQLSEQQGKMARNDALGVFIIGLPVGSMGQKDHKQEIAKLKGRCGG